MDGASGVAGGGEVERFQKLAAEQVAGDESWRDGLEDEVASPLLDWALSATDRAIVRLGVAGELHRGPGLRDGRPGPGLLAALAGHWRRGEGGQEESRQEIDAALQPHLGPPLFDGRAEGEAARSPPCAVSGGSRAMRSPHGP